MIKPHEYPVIGTWYFDMVNKSQFEIVAIDEKEGLIEIQYFSGEIEEMDMDTWFSLRVASIAAPKDWSGPFEVDQKDEFPNLEDDVIHPDNHDNPPYDSLQ